jgi:hypothetical protein
LRWQVIGTSNAHTPQIKAWQFLFAAVEERSFEVSAVFACQLQAKVAQQEALTWGQFRTGGVSIAGTDYLPPQQVEKFTASYTSSLSCFLARNRAFFGFGVMVSIILLVCL